MWYPLPFPCILALYAFCRGRWGSCVIPRWRCKIFITISCQQSKSAGFAEHLLPSDIRSQGYKQSQTASSLAVHLPLQMLDIAVVISVTCLWIILEWCCNSVTFFTTVAEGGQIFMRLLLFSFMLPCYCVFLWWVVFFLQVLSGDVGEDAEVHAAKLMEVILLQCSGKVDHVSKPFSEGWGALMKQYHGDDYWLHLIW